MSDSRKRHEILSRRPSYRKILDELQGSKIGDPAILPKVEEEGGSAPDGDYARSGLHLHTHAPPGQAILIPVTSSSSNSSGPQLLQLPPSGNSLPGMVNAPGSASEDDDGSSTHSSGHHSLSHPSALTPNSHQGPTLVHYGGGDGQFYVPVSDLQNLTNYHPLSAPRPAPGSQLPGSVVMAATSNLLDSSRLSEESTRKRELRLLKNREAARECRRKKKDYVKCLENRVAVLENQNKALIEELKSLKDLYCNKQE